MISLNEAVSQSHIKGSQLTGLHLAVSFFGASKDITSLRPTDGQAFISHLEDLGKAPATRALYYGTLRRLCKLNAVDVTHWPQTPRIPRTRKREPFPDTLFQSACDYLRLKGWQPTRDLALVLRHTGLRVKVEALESPLRIKGGQGYLAVEVDKGKGGHQREVPVIDPETIDILKDADRMAAIRGLSYNTHHNRWKKAVDFVGASTKMPTLHSLRHAWATEINSKTGDMALVQQLLGHSDPRSTSGYIGDQPVDEIVRRLKGNE